MVSVRRRPLLVALVAILAIALAAATLNTAVAPAESFGSEGPGGFGGGLGADQGPDEDELGGEPATGVGGFGGAFPVIPLPCFPVLNEPWFLLGVAVAAAAGLYWLYRRDGWLTPVAVFSAFLPPAILVHALFTACRTEELRLSLPGGNRSANASAVFELLAGTGGGGAATGGRPLLSLAVVGFLALALVVAIAMLFYSLGDDVAPPPREAAPEPDPEQMAAVGRAAGRAADRLEADADADNAVYRAWREMTEHLEVPNRDASTTAEFAAVAVAAGMAPGDVEELTWLFETVRYGDAPVTEEREARAVAALRRIEAAYAGADG